MTCRRFALLAALSLSHDALAAAEGERFAVYEYRVLGNSVLPVADLERVLYAQLGEDRGIEDVEAARQALEALYRDRGYGAVFVDVPEQTVEGGIVRLRVTEGRVDRVRVSGARYYSNRRILASLPSLEPGSALHLPSLQDDLGAVNGAAARDRRITPVLKAGRTPGTVDVELKVEDSLPLHVSAELNDRYTADTSRTRLNLVASYDNLFQRHHSLALQYQTSPEDRDEVRVLGATYLAPLSGGAVLGAFVVDTNSSFAGLGDIGGFGVQGAGRIYGLRYIAPLPSGPASFQSLSFGEDDKDFRDDVSIADGPTDTTPIHYMNWQAGWSINYFGQERRTSASVGANFGIRGLGNEPDEFAFKRYLARPNYFYLRGQLQQDWALESGAAVVARLQGQWTREPLVSNEQLAIGGADTVRGYLESAQLGDLGAAASFELRSPSLHGRLGPWADDARLLVFADGGVVGRLEPLPEEPDSATLTSAGVGLRLSTAFGLEALLDWAYPFRDSEPVAAGDSRVHFQLRWGL